MKNEYALSLELHSSDSDGADDVNVCDDTRPAEPGKL